VSEDSIVGPAVLKQRGEFVCASNPSTELALRTTIWGELSSGPVDESLQAAADSATANAANELNRWANRTLACIVVIPLENSSPLGAFYD